MHSNPPKKRRDPLSTSKAAAPKKKLSAKSVAPSKKWDQSHKNPKMDHLQARRRILKMRMTDLSRNFRCFRRTINRQKRKALLSKIPVLRRLSGCTSKRKLKLICEHLSPKWRSFLALYVSRFLILHLFVRPIKGRKNQLQYRQFLHDAVQNPELLDNRNRFKANDVKNFCRGVINFVIMFYDELLEKGIISEPSPDH